MAGVLLNIYINIPKKIVCLIVRTSYTSVLKLCHFIIVQVLEAVAWNLTAPRAASSRN